MTVLEIDTEKIHKALTLPPSPVIPNETYDKQRIVRNIRELLKKKDVKLGQIEKAAGCQPGYLSRIEKEGNTTPPSLEFIISAAKLLGVSVDYLLYGSVNTITPTEEFVLDFINTLADDTRTYSQEWEKETVSQLERVELRDGDDWKTTHPLFTFDPGRNRNGNDVFYDSRFFVDGSVEVFGNCYHTLLSGLRTRVFITHCFRGGEDADGGVEIFYELYLVKGYDVDPICCTAETCESITAAVEELYKEIETASAHVHIGAEARLTIDAYLRARKEEKELPF